MRDYSPFLPAPARLHVRAQRQRAGLAANDGIRQVLQYAVGRAVNTPLLERIGFMTASIAAGPLLVRLGELEDA